MNWLYSTFSSIIYALKTISGGQDFTKIEQIALRGGIKTAYLVINYLNFIFAPIVTSGLIVSFFGDIGEKIKYHLKIQKTCHYFYCVDDNTVTLAKGIRNKEKKKSVIVFCDSKNCNKLLAEEIKKMGGILLYKPCQNIFLGLRKRNATFYLLDRDEDKNINVALSLISKYSPKDKYNIKVYAFAHNDSNVQAIEECDKGKVSLRFIDELAMQCCHLLEDYPLHDYISKTDSGNILSVMIIGAGAFGLKMLKTVSWCGQIYNTKLKIRIYDKSSGQIAERFYSEAPELRSPVYDIEFIESDVTSNSFSEQIKVHSSEATLAFISMGDDIQNISTADRVYSFFRKQDWTKDTPLLLTRVRNSEKVNNISETKFLKERNIKLFGNLSSVYSDQVLFHTELERTGLFVHLCYCGCLDKSYDDSERITNEKEYYDSVYNRCSSMAVALHMKSKEDMKEKLLTEGMTEDDINLILVRNEHERWNAYMRSEGYQCADDKQIKAFNINKEQKSNKHIQTKLHSCLIDWDELPALADRFNKMSGEHKNFQQIDKMLIDNLDKINELTNKERK